MPMRRLTSPTLAALDVIALMGRRSLPWHEFELRMHERGCDSRACIAAVKSLERRDWATRNDVALEVTASGYAAALRGANATPPKYRARLRPHCRLPRGLFG
jgi:hypothetical protein